MTRITPRTCLWPLAGSVSVMFGLSLGLTFRSNHHCYAGTCGEWLFPLQARLHVVVWYVWLSLSITFLALRTFHPKMRKILVKPLFESKLPLIRKQLAISGLGLVLWVSILYGVITAIWWTRLETYFTERGNMGGVRAGNGRLAAIALTGHYCDVTMGMALIPISRHSALASFFKISVATTLTFHMLTAYMLFALVTIHGLLYVSWVPIYEGLSDTLRMVYPVLNPTYLFQETWPGMRSSLGIWRSSLIFTGSLTALIMLLLFITTLPFIRSRYFNIFYFTHLFSILAVIIVCLHASTMFYCTSPGLTMWLLDWSMRLYELRTSLNGHITALGKGWYSLTIPMPRRRLDGCSCKSPLAHFYIYHPESSVRELHPFTTTTHLASQSMCSPRHEENIMISFLFRKRGKNVSRETVDETKLGFAPSVFAVIRRLKWQKKKHLQWTDRLAALADGPISTSIEASNGSPAIAKDTGRAADKSTTEVRNVDVALRLEGPYFTPADPLRYHTVVCVVAGTGVSGALAIAGAFTELNRQTLRGSVTNSLSGQTRSEEQTNRRKSSVVSHLSMQPMTSSENERLWKRCIVLWTVRSDDYIDLPGLSETSVPGLEIRVHKTGQGKPRLDIGEAIDKILEENIAGRKQGEDESMWVYVSGPNAFIATGLEACKERRDRGVEPYGAKWEL